MSDAAPIMFTLFYGALGALILAIAGWLTLRAVRSGLLGKECRHYFASPMAWLVMAGFTFVNGYVFLFIVDHYSGFAPNEPMGRLYFGNGFFWILQFILIPAITMRLIAEERSTGTLETLMTAPVTDAEVVFAKWLAAVLFYAALWVPSLIHLAIAYYYGVPDNFRETVAAAKDANVVVSFFRELNATMDFGPLFSAYLGILLMGSAWISLGVLTSAFARNQVVAFVGAFVLTIMSFAVGFAEGLFPSAPSWVRELIRYLSFQNAYEPFSRGVVDSRALVYFVTLSVLALFFSVRVVESRKWR